MKTQLNSFSQLSKSNAAIHQPDFFRLNKDSDKKKLDQLLAKNPHIAVFDELQGQLEELVKSQHPKVKFGKEQLTEAAEKYLGSTPAEEYGVWVYYPWSSRLVHVLDEKEFIDLRTNRNQYKITLQERDLLAQKKIGVIGLSVGQSIAVTLAMERSFGELRLADFDILELTNLNRIRTGIHNLGISKTIAVAREIAEIDPFLKVICYPEGLVEENMDDFFLKNGKLDILVDECDGLDIKVLCRQKAKSLQIPVVMDTSDKGLLDVERFDLEPDRSIMHGLIDHLDIAMIRGRLTNEEKIPYLLPMVGAETISSRLKASMMEVEQTITTWPQLASGVVLGGGLGADVCRRILLDQFHDSGRYFVDLEELISNKNKKETNTKEGNDLLTGEIFSESDMISLVNQMKSPLLINDQLDLEKTVIKQLVDAACMAPSGGNIQPWKWFWRNKTLYLFQDTFRKAFLLDFQDTSSHISLGAAAENLVLKAHALNMEVVTELFPLKVDSRLTATFKFFDKKNANGQSYEPHPCDLLENVIDKRLTNRKIAKREVVGKEKLNELQSVVKTISGADLRIIDEDNKLFKLGEIIAKTERMRMMHKEGHKDFLVEIRWNSEQAQRTRDGVDMDTIDITPSERAGISMAKDWSAIQYLNDLRGGTAFEKVPRKSIAAASALGLITMPKYSPVDFFNGGRAIQRVWLAANKNNISFHPVTMPTIFFNRLLHGGATTFPDVMRVELEALRKEFTDLFAIDSSIGEIFLFRLCIADQLPIKSLRRPTEEVLFFGE